MRLVLAADPWGVELKETIKKHLIQHGHEVTDLGGTPTQNLNYYDLAATAAKMIQHHDADRGILFCGTGMGMAIVANKFKGIYASVIESTLAAKLCAAINNANILPMGGLLITPFIATQAVDAWLTTPHTTGFEEHTQFLCDALKHIATIEETANQ